MDDSPKRKTGATVTSGSLWKMLGFAWCWKWRKFHQCAEKPCGVVGSQGWGRVTPTSPRGHAHLPMQPRPHPHLQLPHHKLLGQVVPSGIPEDGRVAQVVLQTPALGLGRRRVRGCGQELPGVQPGALASQPSQLTGHPHSWRPTLDPSGPASFFFLNLVFIFWLPGMVYGILGPLPGIEPAPPCIGSAES